MKATLGWTLVLVMGGSLVPSDAAAAARVVVRRAAVRPARVVVRGPRLAVFARVPVTVRRGHGELHVEVDPERAKVWIDGRYVGRGDTTEVVRAGRHTVRVELANGQDASQTVEVDAGHRTRVRLDLD
jgi:hypothetical protein